MLSQVVKEFESNFQGLQKIKCSKLGLRKKFCEEFTKAGDLERLSVV